MLLDTFDYETFRYRYSFVQVKPRHPDFKGKDGGLSLWLDKVPDWVLPKLNGLELDVFVPKGKLKLLKGNFA